MSFTVGDVILSARDLNPAFTPERHPDPVCRRFLERYIRRLVGEIAIQQPDVLQHGSSSSIVFAGMPQWEFDAGFPLSRTNVLYVMALPPGASNKDADQVTMRPHARRLTTDTAWPWATIRGPRLFLGGTLQAWQRSYASVSVTLAPAVTPVTNNTVLEPTPLPDTEAMEPCVLALGAFLASRHSDGPDAQSFDASRLRRDAQEAESQYLATIRNRSRGQVWKIREVW